MTLFNSIHFIAFNFIKKKYYFCANYKMKELNNKIKAVNKNTGILNLFNLKNDYQKICLNEEVSDFDSVFFRSVYNAKLFLFY